VNVNRPPAPFSPRSPTATPESARTPSRESTSSTRASSSGVLGGLSALRRGFSPASAASEARAAVRKGDTAKLLALLEASPHLATELDSHKDNLLAVAARAGRGDAVEILLRHAAAAPGGAATLLNHRNATGDTALTLAVAAEHLEAVASLLSAPEIDTNLANNKGQTALHLAIGRTDAALVGGLLAHAGTDPNLADAKGNAPLHLAVTRNDGQVAELLLSRADIAVNQADAQGRSPLLVACERGGIEGARQLLKHPDVDVRVTDDAYGNSMLHRLATEIGFRSNWITLLASHPELANQPNLSGQTPLELAIHLDRHEAVSALLDGGAINTRHWGTTGHPPLEQALLRFLDTPAAHHVDRRINMLKVLAGHPKVDPNLQFPSGHTMLTRLCDMASPKHHRDGFIPSMATKALLSLLKANNERLDLNLTNGFGKTPVRVAVDGTNQALISALLNDQRTDPNVLVPWLSRDPAQAYLRLRNTSRTQVPPQAELERYVETTLAQWVDRRTPDGRLHRAAHLGHAELGYRLGRQEKAAAKRGEGPAEVCVKDANHHLSMALEQCVGERQYRFLANRAQLLLDHAPATQQHFNLQGIDIPRNTVQAWAAGKLPDGGINRQIDKAVDANKLAGVHQHGFTARGSQILHAIDHRLTTQRLTAEQSIEGVGAAIAEADGATPEWREKVANGLKVALGHEGIVREGLNVTVRDALAAMWSHIQSYAHPPAPPAEESADEAAQRETMRGALTGALLENLSEIAAGLCDTGCVQQILYAADGLDLSLFPSEPSADVIRGDIETLAGAVNNRFEDLYGHSTEDLDSRWAAASSSTAVPLSDAERKLIERYQSGQEIDDGLVIQVKQDMLEVAVLAELVEQRGWREAAVRPELDRIKASMSDA
jgi:ankyrin repeat protein